MDITRQREIAEGGVVDRREVVRLLRASRAVGQHAFTRRLAESWLLEFPGDLGIALVNAEAQWAHGRKDLAIAELKRLLLADPEFLQAQVMLAHIAAEENLHLKDAALGNVAILAGSFKDASSLPDWARSVLASRAQREILGEDGYLAELKNVVAQEPPTPLPALLAYYVLRQMGDRNEAFEWARGLRERWPDCLAFRLAVAEGMLGNGQEAPAVNELHAAASLDVTGQVAERLWGTEHPFQNIWPRELAAPLHIQIPASVAAALGWNALMPGPSSAPGKRRKAGRPGMKAPARAREEIITVQEELDRLAAALHQPQLVHADGRFPAYVILTNRRQLEEKFGQANMPALDQSLARLSRACQKRGRLAAHLLFVDDAASTERFGISPISGQNPWEVKNFIRDLDGALKIHGERIAALLIVGGPEIIPFHLLPNPVDDEDHEVPSDNPYATLDENYFVPAWPVGRLPTGKDADPAFLRRQIEKIASAHERAEGEGRTPWWRSLLRLFHRRPGPPSLGITAQVWQRTSHVVFRTIGKHQALSVSPPLDMTAGDSGILPAASLGYYNLHGLADAPEWFGQRDPLESPGTTDFPVALRPQDIQNGGRAPEVVFSEACYGANIINKNTHEAIVLKFLASGTRAFAGSTCISYGSVSMPLIAGDLLGKYFWTSVKEGHPAGEALRRAKIQLAQEMDRRQGYLDGEDQKTLISFVLYGDPLAALTAHSPAPKFPPRQLDVLDLKTTCARQDAKASPAPISEDVIRQVRAIVKEYLPGMAGASLGVSREHLECTGHDCPTRHIHGKSRSVTNGGRRVVTLTKRIPHGRSTHTQLARLTLDETGRLAKLVVSR